MQFRRQPRRSPDDPDLAADEHEAAPARSQATAPAQRHPAPRPLSERTTIRLGAYAWSLIGMVGVLVILAIAISRVSILAIPLVIALFPAAILAPLATRLKARGLRDALVATLLVVGTLVAIAGIIYVLVPIVSDQIEDLGEALTVGVEDLRTFLARGPFGFQPIELDALIEQARERIQSADIGAGTVGSVAGQVGRFLAGLAVFIIALFFYLKDGPEIAAWLRRQFPRRVEDDAAALGVLVWTTIGSYFRGQLLVALIDAIGIYIGLKILRVPLAEPVGVLVFFGSLFPVVGAFVSGFVAVVIALAFKGPVTALIVLGIVLGVQQLEGNVLQPVILGRATQLHPLAVVGALIAGGTLLGILGAFLAVPVVASAWRAISYLRARVPD